MKKKAKSYKALFELAEYSVSAGTSAETLTPEDLDASLTELGVDVERLEKTTVAKVKRLRNRMNALASATEFKISNASRLSVEQMRRALVEEGQLVAARASESLSDEDIETIYRLTHPENESEPDN